VSRALIVSVLCFLGSAGRAGAADAVVGTGSPASCNEAALNAAVASVNSGGGTMTFNCGGAATINITSEKQFNAQGAVYAIDGGGLVTISGQNVTRIIFHRRGTLYVRNITLRNGRAQGTDDNASGGAIRSDDVPGPALGLTNVVFQNNFTNLTGVLIPGFSPFDYGGGAVFSRLGFLQVTNCTFTGNTANNSSGGAIHARSSTIDIAGSTFTSNASNGGGFGGAIFTDGLSPSGSNGTLRIASSSFTSNSAFNIGGAFYHYMYQGINESVTLDRVTYSNNVVNNNIGTTFVPPNQVFGGAGMIDQGSATVLNSTFSGNTATKPGGDGSGGGIAFSNNESVTVVNSTVSGNRAEGTGANASGGGVLVCGNAQPIQIRGSTIASNFAGWAGGGILSCGSGVLSNTVVAYNTAAVFGSQCSAELANGGGVLHYPAPAGGNPSCAAGAIMADPLLQPLASNGGPTQTRALAAGSAAIDAGSNGACPATDQRGWPRPLDGDGSGGAVCDLGAFERLATLFADVPQNHPQRAYIETVFNAGVTSGCSASPPLYCPGSSVTRGQMAVFLLRSKEGGNYSPPNCTVPTFGDVPCSHTFAAWIEELAGRGITAGCNTNPPLYCPEGVVTRGQMAVFLLRTLNGSGYVPSPCQGVFADLPCSDGFAAWAEDLYDLGVTSGCNTNPLRYCPNAAVTRGEMAVFLVRTFNIP